MGPEFSVTSLLDRGGIYGSERCKVVCPSCGADNLPGTLFASSVVPIYPLGAAAALSHCLNRMRPIRPTAAR